MKQEKGITLIALVITIIVLLILAGVTIAMIAGNDSAPTKAAQAKIENAIGAAKDTVAMNAAEMMSDYYTSKYTGTSSTTTAASAGAFMKTESSDTNRTGLFKGVSASEVAIGAIDNNNQFTLTSVSTVASGSDSTKYQVRGTIDTNGGITWTDLGWATGR